MCQIRPITLLCAAAMLLVPVAAASAQSSRIQPPEYTRLSRQAFDYHERNSNNNVFRNSRQFSPDRNAFRSSRHYQQKLNAALDGYPLRTFVRYGVTGADGRRGQVTYDWAHHLGRYYGSTGGPQFGFDRPVYPGFGGFGSGCDGGIRPTPLAASASAPAPRRIMARQRPRQQHEIETRVVKIHDRAPVKERPVLRTETLPDGTTRTYIVSVPLDGSADADQRLADAKANAPGVRVAGK